MPRAWRVSHAQLGLVLLLAGALHGAQAGTPFQARCEAGPRASIRFSTRDEGYRIDHSESYRKLTQMKQPGPGGFVLGLTHAEYRVAITVEGQVENDPDAPYECLSPRIDVRLSYEPIVVYIGREIGEGSCAWREVLAHEMRHLDAYMVFLPHARDSLQANLARRFHGRLLDGRPIYAPRGEALQQVQRELDRSWMPYIKREMAKAKPIQAAIDSPREYARLSKVCQGEVQSLIGSTRRSRS